MPDTIDLSQDFLPLAALIDALGAAREPAERATLRKQFEASHKKADAALSQTRAELYALYESMSNADNDEVVKTASLILEKWRAAAEKLRPGLDHLKDKLFAPLGVRDPEARRAIQIALELGSGYLALLRNLHDKLLKLAAERRAAAGEILRARPVAGEIDYAELSRDTIAKFPKILAALAK